MPQNDADARTRLIQAATELVAQEGVGAASLREIARRAGVSHGAPRRYFPTHLSLLSAIARQGFEQLAARAADVLAARSEDTPREQLAALCHAYLDFALTNRGMFELMCRHDLLESNHLGLRDTSLPLFSLLTGLVAQARPGDGGHVPEIVAGALWANVHGIAQLWQWGSLPLATGRDDVEPLLRAALDAHLGPAR